MDIYTPTLVPLYTRRPNCWTRARIDAPIEDCTMLCTVKEVGVAVWSICSFTPAAPKPMIPTNFWQVMQEWGCGWLWDNLQIVGPTDWLSGAIAKGSCIGVTDGSYMRELRIDICAVAFFFESADKSCKLVGSFAEPSGVVNAYRGELLGLLALHLILLAVNTVNPEMDGLITLHSDYLGALSRVESLSPGKIPSVCKHADILKTILIACEKLTFRRWYKHVEAHQDDEVEFNLLPCVAQLNRALDASAKRELVTMIDTNLRQQ